MGVIKQHKPVKFFCAVTFCNNIKLSDIADKIESVFGEIELQSGLYNFSQYTDYYKAEMGDNLKKNFIAFTKIREPELLVKYKIETNQLEKDFLSKGRRTINIDPGYLTEAKIILATTKDYSHRIYLGEGIFGDLHLFFENGSFRKQQWTYPDYRQDSAIDFFNKMRLCYREQLIYV